MRSLHDQAAQLKSVPRNGVPCKRSGTAYSPRTCSTTSTRNVWVRMEGDLAFVGIDSVLAWLSGPFTSVSFKEPGTVVDRGKSLGSVEGPRHFDTVRTPLTGRIILVNARVRGGP